MTPEQLKFINTWLLSKEEANRRHNLIIEDIDQFKNSSVFARKVLMKSAYKMLVDQCKFMAMLKPITDSELMNFLVGVFTLPIYNNNKDVKLGEEVDKLMQPAIDKFSKYVTSKVFQSILIEKEISGEEILRVGSVDVKLSHKEIVLQIGRTKNFLPLIPADIYKIEKNLVDYKRKQYLDEKTKSLDGIEQVADQIALFKENVGPYGFFKLSKVAELSPESMAKLLDLIVKNTIPYKIAMLDYLGFINHLRQYYFPTLGKRDKEISSWFGVGARTIQGNIDVLTKNSNDDYDRYTSHNYKTTVEEDYSKLKITRMP